MVVAGRIIIGMKALAIKFPKLYPKPTDVRLIQVLGGVTLTIGFMRDRVTGYPLTIVFSKGRLLKSEHFRRAVLDNMGVLANDVKRAIALQGVEYERDVVAAYERDERLKSAGWNVLHIPAHWLWTDPSKVRQTVGNFVYH